MFPCSDTDSSCCSSAIAMISQNDVISFQRPMVRNCPVNYAVSSDTHTLMRGEMVRRRTKCHGAALLRLLICEQRVFETLILMAGKAFLCPVHIDDTTAPWFMREETLWPLPGAGGQQGLSAVHVHDYPEVDVNLATTISQSYWLADMTEVSANTCNITLWVQPAANLHIL